MFTYFFVIYLNLHIDKVKDSTSIEQAGSQNKN